MLEEYLKALRSGKYEQCYTQLRRGDKFCALGVACDIFPDGKWKDNNFLFGFCPFNEDLPRSIADALGFNSITGKFFSEKYQDQFGCCDITVLNDVHEFTFSEIADIIESRPEGLFK